MDHAARLRQLQLVLPENKLDLLLVTHLPNIQYLTGFTGSAAALLVGDGRATLFTDGRYIAQARQEVTSARIVISSQSPLLAAAEWLLGRRERSGKSTGIRGKSLGVSANLLLGIEPESLTAGARERLAAALHGKVRRGSVRRGTIRVKLASPLVERARMVKDSDEIQHIRDAVKLGASLFRVACNKIRPGVREIEVAAAMEYEARRKGAEGMSFPTILAAGARSAVVHGRASSARIPARGFVVCDFGVILAGYCSDRTRTVHVGRPSKQARQFYGAVLEAQLAAIAAVRPGITAAEVDGAARDVLRKHKLARWFTHSTGHGLGLEIHEAPRLAAGQPQKLEPGTVVTIEPGAYVPGKWGVRIEDVVVVTAAGCEVLTPADKELVVI
ncbi:MAG: Xaa-Pro peptidase family protein [Terriglobales bacterium]